MRSARNPRAGSEAAAHRLALLAADLGAADTLPAPDPPPRTPEDAGDDRSGGAWWHDHTRVVPARRAAEPEPGPSAEPAAIPSPGRHAARRPRRAVSRVPVPPIGPAHLTVVAVLVAAGLAVTAWWVVRGRAEPAVVTPPAPATVEPLVAASDATPRDDAGEPAATVTVDVAGKVRRPGIVVLDAGARVVDALEAAGGPRPGVDLAGLNLARLLVDGEQVVVGPATQAAAPPTQPPTTGGATGPPSPPADPASLVNLNLATPAELESLPEVGPVTAAAIVAWRDEHGGFTAVDELLEVDGIGEVTLQQIAPYVTV